MSFGMGVAGMGTLMRVGCTAVVLPLLAGCGGSSPSPITDSLTGTALGPKAYDPKGFVVETRPTQQDYMPVGVTPPARSIKPKTAAELAAEKASLDAQAQAATASGAAIQAEGARVKAAAPRKPVVE